MTISSSRDAAGPTDAPEVPGAEAGSPPNPRRWAALTFIGLAQLMIVLDMTIVNIALPSAQKALAISDGNRQWIITAYTLAFGSLLFLGGRIADYTGRRRAFMIGLIGFAGASALGGASPNFGTLLAARTLQGMFAALLAPAVLALISVNFTKSDERAKAFGILGAIAAGGGAFGLIVGGTLTEYLDWRWCLFVNVPIAVVAAFGWYTLPADHRAAVRARFDLPGVVLVVAGLLAVVYGCSEAESSGWSSGKVIGLLVAGVVLLAVFVVVESRVTEPLLPLRVLLNRTRGSAYLAVGLAIVGMFSLFLFLTYYEQVVRGYSPVKTGCAFLPLTAGVLAGAGGISRRLLPKLPPRAIMAPGLLFGAIGVGWLTVLSPTTSYAGVLLPAQFVIGLGMGLVMAPAMNYATYGVDLRDTGVASASVTTMQQIGGSIGIALLNTIATSATTSYVGSHAKSPALLGNALTHGFTTGFGWAAGILAVAVVLVAALMNTPAPDPNAASDGAPAVHMG
ncbi:MFS transporter [Streptacidiphilus sp. EB129]|uniref:MFS transporter n=1 Tax=Streptacidiphilus sp. EB129 TaxID=3156262 RepID=UPI00351610CD